MKIVSIICLIALGACSHQRNPASVANEHVAKDTMALGNIQATAVKRVEQDNVCFDITLLTKGTDQQAVLGSNWTAAWIDKTDHFHLLSMNQRTPASAPKGGQVIAPYGAYTEWSNDFTTCASKAQYGEVKSLVLTPKDIPYREGEGLRLNWN